MRSGIDVKKAADLIRSFARESMWFPVMFPAAVLGVVWVATFDTHSRMGNREYAYEVCSSEVGNGGPSTWGEVEDLWKAEVKRFERGRPPEGLQEYHDARLDYARTYLEVVVSLHTRDEPIENNPGIAWERPSSLNEANDQLIAARDAISGEAVFKQYEVNCSDARQGLPE